MPNAHSQNIGRRYRIGVPAVLLSIIGAEVNIRPGFANRTTISAHAAGETTGGGAHLVAGRRINDHFSIGVPSGRPINAVTKTDWEGAGVEPDVKVSADSALKTAHLALEKQEQTLPADAPGLRNEVSATIQTRRNEPAVPATSGASGSETMKSMPASKASEDFESGTLANWKVERSGAGGWFIYTNGKTPPNPAQSDPNLPFDIPNPPQGKFAAVTDMNGPGRRILYRDVTLDGRYRLHLTVFYVNAGRFSATDTSRPDIGDEQQYRIDLVSPSAPIASAAKDHVLATIFRGQPGDPPRRQPAEVTFDLSQWNGQTVRLRLASADNQGPLRAGVDDIRFERIGQQRRTTSLLPSGLVARIPGRRQSSRSPAFPSRAVPRGWSSSLSSPQPPDSPPREEYVPI